MAESRRRKWIVAAALVAAVLALYAPVREFEFVNLDDNEYVFANPFVRTGLTAENVRWALTAFHSGHWHPLTWLSLMLDCHLFGPSPGALHVGNVLFHAAGVVVLFLWLAAATGRLGCSAFAAALFALHPLRVESVAWITARKDVLSGLLLMLTCAAYVAYAQRSGTWPRARVYLALLVCFGLGLLAKPTLAVVPAGLLLLDFWPLRRFGRETLPRLMVEKLPLFAMAAATLLRTMASQQAAGALAQEVPLAARVANALWSYVCYLGKTVWPSGLAVFYPLESISPTRAFTAAALLLAVTVWVVRERSRHPYAVVGWLWFAGTLLPVSGLIQFGGQAMADRYSYIPHVGLLVLATWGAADLTLRAGVSRPMAAIAGTLILAACTAISARQLTYWRDSVALFERAIAVTDDNFLAHNNLGVVLEARGDQAAAARHYAAAVRINPTWPEAQANLGNVFAWRGDYAAARQHYAAALRVRPGFAVAENNMGTAYAFEGNFEAAIVHYTRAVAIDPGYVDAHHGLADALERTGRLAEAERHYAAVVAARPGWEPAVTALARVRRGRRD